MSRDIRDVKELAADIEKYDLLTRWTEEERHVLKTKEDADEYFRERDFGETRKAGTYARIAEGKTCVMCESRTKFQPVNQENGRHALEWHIEDEWTVGEILFFRHFLHGGDFVSPEGWKVGHSGMTFKTPTEDGELEQMWSGLVSRAFLLMGAICGAGQYKGASMKFGYADMDPLLGFTLNELVRLVPETQAACLASIQEQSARILKAVENPEPPKPGRKRRGLPYKAAAQILKGLNCPRSVQTLKNWRKGKGTPEGFTPEKLDSLEAFTAWAKVYANREQNAVNTRNAIRNATHIDNPRAKRCGHLR